jgi:hypothetical protein
LLDTGFWHDGSQATHLALFYRAYRLCFIVSGGFENRFWQWSCANAMKGALLSVSDRYFVMCYRLFPRLFCCEVRTVVI